jgi:hypothetical protein
MHKFTMRIDLRGQYCVAVGVYEFQTKGAIEALDDSDGDDGE